MIIIKNILLITGSYKTAIIATEKREFIFEFQTPSENNHFLFMLANCLHKTTGRPVYVHPSKEVVAKKLIVKAGIENGDKKGIFDRDTKFYEEQKMKGLELAIDIATGELQYIKPAKAPIKVEKGKKKMTRRIQEQEEEEKTEVNIFKKNKLPNLKNGGQYKQNDRYKEIGDDSDLFDSGLNNSLPLNELNQIPKNNRNFKKNERIFEMNEDRSSDKEDPFNI